MKASLLKWPTSSTRSTIVLGCSQCTSAYMLRGIRCTTTHTAVEWPQPTTKTQDASGIRRVHSGWWGGWRRTVSRGWTSSNLPKTSYSRGVYVPQYCVDTGSRGGVTVQCNSLGSLVCTTAATRPSEPPICLHVGRPIHSTHALLACPHRRPRTRSFSTSNGCRADMRANWAWYLLKPGWCFQVPFTTHMCA